MTTSNHKPKTPSSSAGPVLPLLPVRDMVIFPYMVAPLFVGRTKSVRALADAMGNEKWVFMATQRKADKDNPTVEDICSIGTVAKVLQLLRLPDGSVKALVEGKARAQIVQFTRDADFFKVQITPIEEIPASTPELAALARGVVQQFQEYAKQNPSVSQDLVKSVTSMVNPVQLADTLSAHFNFKFEDKQRLLETLDLQERFSLLLNLIKIEIDIFQVDQRIKNRVKEQIDKTQRSYYLNEQIRAIKKEMGTDEDLGDDLKELEKQIQAKKMSEEASAKVQHELKKLKMMSSMSAEATVVRTYIDWMISLPWYEVSDISTDLNTSEHILNEDHYGLEKPKERILEYLAVQTLVKQTRGPILCFVGPPGVGKTSLAKSVARATGRQYVRLSLGGVRDEAQIRGHRRTYIGSMPGKIIQSLKKAGVNNPVFCLDEVDKMSMDFRGDPSAALLEVLDPEQNYNFNDHYLDVDYDLSGILFITTANTLPDIPLPLQDRMEIIRLSGYTEVEKLNIAEKHLVAKELKLNGLEGQQVQFSRNALLTIIQRYTREAGVRNLEREIASICRKVARDLVQTPQPSKNEEKKPKTFKISSKSLMKYLGPPRFRINQVENTDQIGMATGLAWTQAGGELLTIEALTMPGKGNQTVTGKLGDVMKESAQAAVSYVRSRAERLLLDKDFYQNLDIHIHVPEGATPKDGPSAGIAMCSALVSVLTRRPVCRDVAMTGEITLRGRVLPIGGLKEKILAAHRSGIKKVLYPRENEKDMQDIPVSVQKQIECITVEHMDDVLKHAMVISPGETVFQEGDIMFDIMPEQGDLRVGLV